LFGLALDTVVSPQLLKMASCRNWSSVQANKQVSSERHRGKSLSCGNNYVHELIFQEGITSIQANKQETMEGLPGKIKCLITNNHLNILPYSN
jgi:hypothetical protein